jgi:formylglycine-generating enzyme required for sulfatase activity
MRIFACTLSIILVLMTVLPPSAARSQEHGLNVKIKAEDGKELKLYDRSYVLTLGLLAATLTQPVRAAAPQDSQQAKRPIRRDGLVKALQLNALTAKELADLIRKRGVDFKLTPEIETELREAGATQEVIEAVRESYRETAASRVDPAQQELAFWNSIQSSNDPEDFKDYLEKYPDGLYAGIARRKLAALTGAAKPAPAGAPTSTQGAARPATQKPPVTNNIGMELVYVPAGSSMMGSENGGADEQPVHRVTIGKPFYMGKYEVTQAQWQDVMSNNPSRFKGSNLPVEQVSWDDAQDFIRRLNERKDGFIYRLPTEAEWEYACRAGATGDYAGGLDVMGWYGNNSGRRHLDALEVWRTDRSNYGSLITNNGNQTHPVGQKQPNAFGLYDMHGNVWEWCQDWYHDTYAVAPSDGSAWESGGEQARRVLRGCSWVSNGMNCRSAVRAGNSPEDHNSNDGLRVVAVARPS